MTTEQPGERMKNFLVQRGMNSGATCPICISEKRRSNLGPLFQSVPDKETVIDALTTKPWHTGRRLWADTRLDEGGSRVISGDSVLPAQRAEYQVYQERRERISRISRCKSLFALPKRTQYL
jgi:hypothetical protein